MGRNRKVAVAVAAVGLLIGAAQAPASIVVTFTEDTAANQTTVVATGSIDTSLFGPPITASLLGNVGLHPSMCAISIAPPTHLTDYYLFTDRFLTPIGSNVVSAGTFVGPDIIGFWIGPTADILRLPGNYVSGSPIHAEGYFDASFADLGIEPDAFVFNLPGDQTITLQIVPEPAAGIFVLLGAVALSLRRRGRPA